MKETQPSLCYFCNFLWANIYYKIKTLKSARTKLVLVWKQFAQLNLIVYEALRCFFFNSQYLKVFPTPFSKKGSHLIFSSVQCSLSTQESCGEGLRRGNSLPLRLVLDLPRPCVTAILIRQHLSVASWVSPMTQTFKESSAGNPE